MASDLTFAVSKNFLMRTPVVLIFKAALVIDGDCYLNPWSSEECSALWCPDCIYLHLTFLTPGWIYHKVLVYSMLLAKNVKLPLEAICYKLGHLLAIYVLTLHILVYSFVTHQIFKNISAKWNFRQAQKDLDW